MAVQIKLHRTDGRTIAEFLSDGVILKSGSDMLDLLMLARARDASNVALHVANISPKFFDLKTGIAGEVLQKLVNYRCRLAIVGDISHYLDRSESLRALVRESNRGRDVCFVPSMKALLGD